MRWGGTCTVYEHCHLHLGKGNANGNLDKHEIQMRQKWWDRPSANNPTFWRSKLRGQLPQQRRGAQAPSGQWEHLGRQRQTLLWAGLLTTHPYTWWRPQSRGRASSVTTQGPHRVFLFCWFFVPQHLRSKATVKSRLLHLLPILDFLLQNSRQSNLSISIKKVTTTYIHYLFIKPNTPMAIPNHDLSFKPNKIWANHTHQPNRFWGVCSGPCFCSIP